MTDPGITAIRIRKGDTVFHVHGDNAGTEGVWLAQGQVHGIYDAPVKTTYKAGAFQIGSQQKARKFLHRDLNLGFHIKETGNLYELNESKFRQVFDYQEDFWDTDPTPTTIEVDTILSGTRKLDVLMYEQPEFEADLDPQMQQYGNLIMKLRAGQPFWYEDDAISTFTDTASTAAGFVMVSNPTDQTMYQKFVLTRATWTLPDVQWVGAKGQRVPGGPNAERAITEVLVSTVNGGATVDLDRQELMFRDANNTNILAQLSGKFFNYAIPPYTPETPLGVSYTGAPAGGAMVQLVQPRRWSRPWGLEHEAEDTIKSATVRFTTAGPYSFDIPAWATTIDVVMLGSGGGGDGGDIEYFIGGGTSNGGTCGEWVTEPWSAATTSRGDSTTITGVVGVGGPGGKATVWGSNSATNGDPTTATAVDMTPLSADGGIGGGNSSDIGQGAGDHTFNTKTYRGGRSVNVWGGNGGTPGGGGASGSWAQSGGRGAGGAVWFRAYETQAGS